ncbi:single-stranded DNA-binding protein [Microbacterium sp. MEC084]|jgi:single-strand DNA-binding protein|uniref:single-stranded DNA-binding protein n=1 Tax=unclassified Microbacterium TaxID=2609290 RepID=UPI0006F457E2|nr:MULTISPECIES: single-stranded DNA-binding protein [unclassified Microbacterium]KQY99287.1 hypothetical protein ASD19_05265 [Microbacterium sp. Root53]MCD1268732.1 single-stranded DNA-binding protein [Microbacterium sp. MEC084]
MGDIITITGNIATEPERNTLPSGIAVTRFRLASPTRRYDRAANAWVDGATNWYSVSAYRGLADNAAASLHKGERVVVSGRLRLRTWESDGRKGMEAEVDADALGHDLRFGTTAFQRTAPRSAAADAQGASGAQEGVQDDWAPAQSTAGADDPEAETLPDPELADATPF